MKEKNHSALLPLEPAAPENPPVPKTVSASAVDMPELNPRQFEAVCHTGGHLLVFAGAGSGKTRVLTSRIAFLVKEGQVRPHEILAVTFTNKAAREMRQRVEALLPDRASGIWMGTFHSICSRILRRDIEKLGLGYKSNFVIYDTGEQKSVIKKCLAAMEISEEAMPPDIIRGIVERLKREGVFPPSERDFPPHEKNVRTKMEVIAGYDAAMKKSNALDFNDLLMLAARLLQKDAETLEKYRKRFRHILVDEYQDTNRVQYQIVKVLGENNADVCVVGDDSQSIYGWRGAEVKNILGFAKDFPGAKVVQLDKNYRSTATILEASNGLISHNRLGVKKDMWTDGEKGEPASVYEARNEFDEADFVVSKIKSLVDAGEFAPGDFAVLYRTNSKSRLIEERFFKEGGISCRVVGALSFYARAEIKDVVSYLRLLTNPSDDAAAVRIINVPPRAIGKATVQKLSEFASSNGLSIMEAARLAEKIFPAKRAAASVFKFARMMDELAEFAKGKGALEVTNSVIEKSGYGELLEKDENRKENVRELVNSASEFDENGTEDGAEDFQGFVEQIALASDSDTEGGDDAVKLMTLHASKGLEFPVVFIVGMNQDLVPLSRKGQIEDIEEERRLCYVGITRAMKRLFMCYPVQVNLYGNRQAAFSSQFFDEIPDELKYYEDFVSDTFFHRSADERLAPLPDMPVLDSPVNKSESRRGGRGGIVAGGYVRHDKFGRGKVQKIEGMGRKATVTVLFPSSGRKRILASFLKKI